MPNPIQAKLLRVLQDVGFQRVGGTRRIPVNIRIIASTSKDLKETVAEGRFLEDLFVRLQACHLTLPPLRDRPENIQALADLFLMRYAIQAQRSPMRLAPAALTALTQYRWPGNVRELENVIMRAVMLNQSDEIGPERLFIGKGPIDETAFHSRIIEDALKRTWDKSDPEAETTKFGNKRYWC